MYIFFRASNTYQLGNGRDQRDVISNPNKSKLMFRSQGSAESVNQPLFGSKKRLLAWKLKRSQDDQPFQSYFFLRASNAY